MPSELLTTTRRRPRACRRASASGTPGITLRHNTLARPSGRSTWRSSVTSASNSPGGRCRNLGSGSINATRYARNRSVPAGTPSTNSRCEKAGRAAASARRSASASVTTPRRAEFGGHPVEVDRDQRVADVEEHGVDVGVGNGAVGWADAHRNRQSASGPCYGRPRCVRSCCTSLVALWAGPAWSQTVAPGRAQYEQFCARCHGGDGRGGQMGPAIVARLSATSDAALTALIAEGLPSKGMPGVALPAPDLRDLLRFLRTLSAPAPGALVARPRRDGRWRRTRRRRAESVVDRPAAALRRRAAPSAAPLGPSVPARQLRRRLARLSRLADRQPVQSAGPDQPRQRRAAGAGLDVHAAWRRTPAGDARRRRRRDVRHQRERVLRARRRIRPAHLALPASADQGAGGRCGGRHQSRRRRQRRSGVHGHRRRAAAGAEPVYRGAAVGHRDGRLAAELRRDLGAAGRRRACRLGDFRRRRGRARVSGGVRSGDGPGGVALLDRARAGRTGRRDVARPRPRARVCVDVADRHLRRRARHAVLADRQSVSRTTTEASGWATTCTRIRSSRSSRPPGG